MVAPLPHNESSRLEALYRLGVLDTPREAVFDPLTKLAAEICQMPIARLSLVDADREWFKSTVGQMRVRTAGKLRLRSHYHAG